MNETHIRSAYDRDLEAIQASLLKMGGLVEEAILQGAEALAGRDVEAAARVGDRDAIIPSVAGWARMTGYNTIFIDERDPFAHGFVVK